MSKFKINGCELEGGGACPEQYDVTLDGEKIGYLRLRHGAFRAEHLPSDDIVLEASPRGDGEFYDDERMKWLTLGVNAILFRHKGGDDIEAYERAELARLKAKYEGSAS